MTTAVAAKPTKPLDSVNAAKAVGKSSVKEETATLVPNKGRPDEKANKEKVAAVTKEVDQLKSRMEALRVDLAKAEKVRNQSQSERKELFGQIDQIRQQQTAHQAVRKTVLDQIAAVQGGIRRKGEDIKSNKNKLPFRTAQEFDLRIMELEAMVSSGTMKLIDEKRMLSDISNLRKQRKVLESYGSLESGIDEDKKKLDELQDKLKSLDPESKRFKTELDALFTKLKSIDEKRDEDRKTQDLYKERDEINKKIRALVEERRQLNADFKKRLDEYYAHVRELAAKREEQRKKEQDEYVRMKKLRSIEEAKELAQLPAFETEITLCNALISLLSTYISTDAELSSEVNGTVAATKELSRSVNAPAGMALKKKSDRLEEESYMVLGKKKAASSGSGPRKESSSSLKFDLAVMNQFLKLSVAIPSKVADVPATIESLKKLKINYQENQERVTKENIAKAKAMEEAFFKKELEAAEKPVSPTNDKSEAEEKAPEDGEEEVVEPEVVVNVDEEAPES